MVLRPALALGLTAALALAGCGNSGTTTVTQVQTVSNPGAATTTSPKVPDISAIPAHTDTTPSPPPSNGTLSEAEAKVRSQGYTPDDPNDYDSSHTLRVLVGTRSNSGDGYAKRAFFFVGGRYLGTDTSDDSAGIRVESQSDVEVTLGYALYGSGDALCCPSGNARVRYQWNGSRLVPLDPIPPRSRRG